MKKDSVARVRGEEQTVIARRARVRQTDIPASLATQLPAVMEWVLGASLRIVGAPLVRYEDWADGEYLSTIHWGDYATVDSAYAAIESWAADHELQLEAAVYESYRTDPDEHPDPADWQTEVFRRIVARPESEA